MKHDSILNATLLLVSASSIVMTSVVVMKTFGHPSPAGPAMTRKVDNWTELSSSGHPLGPENASVQMVIFSDFQCPACNGAARMLEDVRTQYAGRVVIRYRHFPLEQIHPFARTAALASECAASQGRFQQFHDALFNTQDSIGIKSWSEYSREAGVADLARFQECLQTAAGQRAVENDVAAGTALGIRGTPTLIVSGQLLQAAPTRRLVDSLIAVSLQE